MFIENKYYRIYQRLTERARHRSFSGYGETHHVIPRALDGTNDPGNLVRLTAREHYIAHLCLVKMTTGVAKQKMVFAANWLAGQHKCRINGRVYQALKEQKSLQMLGNHYNDGKLPWTPEMRTHFSTTMMGKQNSLGRIENAVTRKKKREAQLVRYQNTNGKHLPETIEKMRTAQRLRWAQQKEAV